MKTLVCCFLVVLGAGAVLSQTTNGTTPEPPVTSTSSSPSSSSTAANVCESSTDCPTCLSASDAKCLWCVSDKKCHEIVTSAGDLFKLGKKCSKGLGDARWANCSINMLAVIISMAVIGGLLIVGITVCICCCCCKTSARQKLKWKREDVNLEAAKEDRRQKFEERRAERKSKNDEIRKKYGLIDENGSKGYQRFGDDD